MLEVTLRWTSIQSRGDVEIVLDASCYRNWKKLWPGGLLGTRTCLQALLPLLSCRFLLSQNEWLCKNVSHENDLIFMRMNVQVTYISYQWFRTKAPFATEAKVNLVLAIHP